MSNLCNGMTWFMFLILFSSGGNVRCVCISYLYRNTYALSHRREHMWTIVLQLTHRLSLCGGSHVSWQCSVVRLRNTTMLEKQGVFVFSSKDSNQDKSHPWRKAAESVTCSVIIRNSNTKLNHGQKTTKAKQGDNDSRATSRQWPVRWKRVTEPSKQVDRSD